MLINMHIATNATTKKQVGIDEVKRGKKCNCICNSCGGKLSAKQGKKNQWYFAHVDSSKKDCSYSFWVSVRSLTKQIICETSYIPIKSTLVPLGFMHISNKTISPNWQHNCFDMLVETSLFDVYVNFVTDENEEIRNRTYVNQAHDYFNPIVLLQIDLKEAKNNKKEIGKFLKQVILLKTREKSFFVALHCYKYFVKDSYYPYFDYIDENESYEKTTDTNKTIEKYPLINKEPKNEIKKNAYDTFPLEIEEKEITIFLKLMKSSFNAMENLKLLGFSRSETTCDDERICSEMVPFVKCIEKLNIKDHGSDVIVATYYQLQCVRYKNNFYFFAEIANNFVMYTTDEKNYLYLQKRIFNSNNKVDIVLYIENYLKDSDKF